MLDLLHIVAVAETHAEAQPSLLTALGIDWQMLLLQVIAFLILLWFLGKFVYPQLVKAIDKREKAITASVAAAAEAEQRASETQSEVRALLAQARQEADAIVATAQKEAATVVAEADAKAQKRSERIIADAQAEMARNIDAAKDALRAETTSLVALATEKIIRQKLDTKGDAALIEAALKEAK